MDKLDQVINEFVDKHAHQINQASGETEQEFTEWIKCGIRQKIEEEIKQKYTEEIVQNAKEEINKQKEKERISALRKLLIEGFVVAFFVGILVNQVTNLIAYYWGNDCSVNVKVAWIISFISLGIAVLLYLILFVKEVKELANK